MPNEHITLRQELTNRKFKIPNRLFYAIYKLVMVNFEVDKHRPKIHYIDDPRKEKGAAIVLWNHLSRLDHAYILKTFYPRRFNMVAAYNEFFRSHLHWAFKQMSILPKKNFCLDVAGVKAILSIIKQGGVVSMAPEGLATITGQNEAIIPGCGHLLKHCKVPVYFAKFQGEALVAPVFSEHYRKRGQSEVTIYKMFTPEQIKELSEEEIERRLNEEMNHDDYAYQKEHRFVWDTDGHGCEGMEDICYRCPSCGEEFRMHSEGDDLTCDACGYHVHCNEYLELVPDKDTGKGIVYPTDWARWERKTIIDEIRANPDYSFSFHCKIGTQPEDGLVKGKDKSTEIVGEGTFAVDHQGIHFKGTKNGKPYSLDLSYEQFYRPIPGVNTKGFALYVEKSEYTEFLPEEPVVGKVYLLIPEMARLHTNAYPPLTGDLPLYE